MRIAAAVLLVSACASDPVPPPVATGPAVDAMWGKAIHTGDLVVLIPGTGAYDFLAATIDPLATPAAPEPVVDVRAYPKVADDAIVFEQAIAAAHRAGIPNADLESGALALGLWGAGFTKVTRFTYVSYEGLRVPIEILGGENTCARGLVLENLLHYSTENAQIDATDVYARTSAWLALHPERHGNVIVASHSWGGAIGEWLAYHLDAIVAANGALPRDAAFTLTVAMGVPWGVANYKFAGPGFKTVGDDGAFLLEIDRPDDPVHAMDPSGDGWGHQYDILVGDEYTGEFVGSYGITTTDLTCKGAPGACPKPAPRTN